MATFQPNPDFDRDTSNPKDWSYHLGCLPKSHHIVFTKDEFLQFLKQHGIEVGPNYTELSKLPKYASIGKLTQQAGAPSALTQQFVSIRTAAPATAPAPASREQTIPSSAAESREPRTAVVTSSGDSFRPTRRVRELAGGGSAQISSLFGGGEEEAPARPAPQQPVSQLAEPAERYEESNSSSRRAGAPVQAQAIQSKDGTAGAESYDGVRNDAKMNKGFRPTRRVRVPGGTGGYSSISFG